MLLAGGGVERKEGGMEGGEAVEMEGMWREREEVKKGESKRESERLGVG